MATPRWGGLRLEPYNPNAVDADGDGIVQEGTAWERPGGTTLLDNLGRAIRTGITSAQRPQGMRVVDRDGKDVTYKPTYGEAPQAPTPAGAGKPTPLAEAGAPSLKEMGVLSLKDMGLPTVQQIVARSRQPMTPEQIQQGWSIVNAPNDDMIRQLPVEEIAEYGIFRRALAQIVSKIDEVEERDAISAMVLNSFYWGTVAFDKSGGSWGTFINDIWYSSQDAGFSPHRLFEDLWQTGGAFAISIPIMRAKEKFNLTKQQVSDFTSAVKERMRQKGLRAGEFAESLKQKVRGVFASLGTREEGIPTFGLNFPQLETSVSLAQPLASLSFASPQNPDLPVPEPLEYPKPRYPRQPPASAFTGKASEIFGAAKSWQEVRDLMDNHDIIFLDYETTGIQFDEFGKVISNGQPTQIGAVRMRGGKVVERFNTYINPGVTHAEWEKWSRDNLRDQDGNLITQEFLDQQPSIADAHRQFAEWAGTGAILGMQNAIFDDEVLSRAMQQSGIDWKPDGILDTKEIADMALPRWNPQSQDGPVKHGPDGKPIVGADGNPMPSNGLGDITRYLGVDLGEKHHTADFDAAATGEVFTRIVEGGIERGWSADVLDSSKRKAKEQKNQENFEKSIREFENSQRKWREQNAPSWDDVADILDWDVIGYSGETWASDDALYEAWDAFTGDWMRWDSCREIRQAAYGLAGLTPSDADPNLERTGGYFGNGWQTQASEEGRIEQAKHAMARLADATHGDTQWERPTLYRSIDLSAGDEEGFWGVVQPGQQVDIPLLSFADRRSQGDNEYLTKYGSDVLFVLDESPGSVMSGQIEIMYSDADERETLVSVGDLLDEIESSATDDEDSGSMEFVESLRSLVDEYEKLSAFERDRRAELRKEIKDQLEEMGVEIPIRWSGEEIPEEDRELYYNAFEDYSSLPTNAAMERISGGRMEVLEVTDDPYGVYGRIVRLRQIGAFDPQVPGRLIGRKSDDI